MAEPWLPPDDLAEDLAGKHGDELVDLLRLCRGVSRKWAEVAALVEAELASRLPSGVHQTSEGVPFTVRGGSKKTTWDSDRLWSAVVARALDERDVDPETGEVRESEAACVARVLRSCLGKNPGWIVEGVKGLGLDPDRFRETEGYRQTVQVD